MASERACHHTIDWKRTLTKVQVKTAADQIQSMYHFQLNTNENAGVVRATQDPRGKNRRPHPVEINCGRARVQRVSGDPWCAGQSGPVTPWGPLIHPARTVAVHCIKFAFDLWRLRGAAYEE
jgi:hypothetical protein